MITKIILPQGTFRTDPLFEITIDELGIKATDRMTGKTRYNLQNDALIRALVEQLDFICGEYCDDKKENNLKGYVNQSIEEIEYEEL